jgi:hypothetical protein
LTINIILGPMSEPAIIREPLVRELVEVGSLVRATIAGREKGFALVFHLGNADKTLVTSRGMVRLFASLDTAAGFVRDLGLPQFQVDMTSHQPGRLRSARPDRAEALKQTRTRMHQSPLEFGDAETARI